MRGNEKSRKEVVAVEPISGDLTLSADALAAMSGRATPQTPRGHRK